MKTFLSFIFFTVAILSACGTQPEEPEQRGESVDSMMTGYVMEKEDNRILVVDSEAQDFNETGGSDEFYNAIWFSNVPEEVELGDKVRVWFDITLESYPGQSEANNIEIIPSETPEGASLTESEALQRALVTHETEGVFAVTVIEFDQESSTWHIELKNTMNENVVEMTVEDGAEEAVLERAEKVVTALHNEDFATLASIVHPEKGVRFSPYAHVLPEEHISFTSDQVRSFMEDENSYIWGSKDGKGTPIELTPSAYYEDYLYIKKFAEVDGSFVTELKERGNTLHNADEIYPEAQFVEYYVPASDEIGMDWASLILAFEEVDGMWYVVGIIIDRWTI
ncbi:YobA family protein [Aliibacillus thermotolerans]|uniref:YobA family protein n=1 Tax=Aliibacillus thermotolerans TaxID=1834418 RepID=A0ABW0U6X0_9BACI|nr:YobA family protein [Aliibacillus thermotolerans]MDA3130864.1 DUF3221 domain-containing protein [Aliibacillus thermotolerans]